MAVSRKLKNVKPVIKKKDESNVETMKSTIVIQPEKTPTQIKAEKEHQEKVSVRSEELVENLRTKMKRKRSLKEIRREKENAVPKKSGLLRGGIALAIFFATFVIVFFAINAFSPLDIKNYVEANVSVNYYKDDGNGDTGYDPHIQSLSLYTEETPTESYIQDYQSIDFNFIQLSQTVKISSITFKIKVGKSVNEPDSKTGTLNLSFKLFDINKTNSLVSSFTVNESVTEGEVLTCEWKIREKIDFTKVKEGSYFSGIKIIAGAEETRSSFAIFNLKMNK